MIWNINDTNRQLEYVDEQASTQVIVKFIDTALLQDKRYTLYAYVEVVDGQLYIKFGEAKDQSIYDRYHRGTSTKANDRMIAVWESSRGDREIHEVLKTAAHALIGFMPADKNILNTIEAYHILSVDGLTNLLKIISHEAGKSAVTARHFREDYEDIKELVEFILTKDCRFFAADLCTRWGKTSTYNLLYKKYNELGIRIHIISSYVKTVKRSYSGEIVELTNNENALFVDADQVDATTLKKIKMWLSDAKHYVIYYLPLTGDETNCFKNRTKILKNLQDYRKTLTIEEADFGASCRKQVEKLKAFYENPINQVEKIFATTGTKIDKTRNIFEPECYIKRDYIVDVLANRPNAVGINWTVLNNSEMVKQFGYTEAEMENWTDTFTVENGRLKGELYLRDIIDFLFNKNFRTATKENRKYRNHNLLNDAVTMIWTPADKEAQKLLKKLIELVAPSYRVEVINGDETTNAEAEDKVKQIIAATGTRLILISSGMASRSFSVKEIKNNILMCNAGDGATLTQKCFRGCTPWNEHKEMRNNIIDFRLAYAEPALATYLSGIAVDSLMDTATKTSTRELLKTILGSDKLTFAEYFSTGVDPLRDLTEDEIYIMLESKDYTAAKAIRVVTVEMDTVDMPRFSLNEKLNLSELTNTNIKGDSKRKVYAAATMKATIGKTKEQLEEDQRIQHLAFLLNHKELFISGMFKENVLEQEIKTMDYAFDEFIEKTFNVDMKVIKQIMHILIKNNCKIFD